MGGAILGGILGGGGGGGGAGAGGLIGGTLGGFGGGVAGLLQGIEQKKQAAEVRYALRGGIAGGQADTLRQIMGVLTNPNYAAYANYVRGVFGMGGDYRQGMGQQLMSLYGPQFGQGAHGYDPALASLNMGMFSSQFGNYQDYEKLNLAQTLAQRLQSGLESGAGIDKTTTKQIWQLLGKKMGGQESLQALNTMIGGIQQRQQRSEEQLNRNVAYDTGGPSAAALQASGRDFGLGAGNPLAAQFVKQLEMAQRSRGMYSGQAAASAEASGLAAFGTQLQMQMLPQLEALATKPLELATALEQQNMNIEALKISGGKVGFGPSAAAFGGSPFASAAAGAVAGMGGGASLGAQIGYLSTSQPYGGMSAQQYSDIMSGPGTPSRVPVSWR